VVRRGGNLESLLYFDSIPQRLQPSVTVSFVGFEMGPFRPFVPGVDKEEAFVAYEEIVEMGVRVATEQDY